MTLKTLAVHSILRPVIDLISNFGHLSKKTVALDGTVHLISEENIVTCLEFDCSIDLKMSNYDTDYNEVSPLNRSSHDVENCFSKFVFHICHKWFFRCDWVRAFHWYLVDRIIWNKSDDL